MAGQDAQKGTQPPSQASGNLFRSRFLTQTSNIQNPREQVAFERVSISGDPTFQDSCAGSAYSSVLSVQQPPAPGSATLAGGPAPPLGVAQAFRGQQPPNGAPTAPSQPMNMGSSHPMQIDPQKRQGVNQYLQKKYSQKFNLH